MFEHNSDSKRTINERDAAQFVGFRPASLRAWRREGRGPAFLRIGGAERPRGSIRYQVSDLDAWLNLQRVEPRESRADKGSAPAGGTPGPRR